MEVWLDRETLFPVSHRVVGDSAELETTYTDLEIEPGLEDDLFEFDPSSESDEANGEIDDGGDGDEFEAIVLPSIEEFESVDEADETVSFPVGAPDPDALPDGVERNGVSRYEFPTRTERKYRCSTAVRMGQCRPPRATVRERSRPAASRSRSEPQRDRSRRPTRNGTPVVV